jgi:hypothetical protein
METSGPGDITAGNINSAFVCGIPLAGQVGFGSEEAHMADPNSIRERNPMRDDQDVDPMNEEDLVGQADEDDLDDIDDMEEDDDDLEA